MIPFLEQCMKLLRHWYDHDGSNFFKSEILLYKCLLQRIDYLYKKEDTRIGLASFNVLTSKGC